MLLAQSVKIKDFILSDIRYSMGLDFQFWIRESKESLIYKVEKKNGGFYLYEHYVDQDLASNGEFELSYLGCHGICEQVFRDFNIKDPIYIAEEPEDLYEIRSLSQELS